MADTKTNRRRSARINANLNLEVKVALADGSESTVNLETINISSSGVYFKSDHFIEPMTKLGMELEVCVPNDDGESEGSALVPCEGLVVRSNPEAETEGCEQYEIAVFFTHIEPAGMDPLERHISLLIDNID